MAETSNDVIRYKILDILYKVVMRDGTNLGQVDRSYLVNELKVDENLIDCNVLYLCDSKLARLMQINSTGWETVVITAKGVDVYEHKADFASEYPFIKIEI